MGNKKTYYESRSIYPCLRKTGSLSTSLLIIPEIVNEEKNKPVSAEKLYTKGVIIAGTTLASSLVERGKEKYRMATVQVRYIVHDVDAAIAFYCQHLGFHEEMHPAPAFAK